MQRGERLQRRARNTMRTWHLMLVATTAVCRDKLHDLCFKCTRKDQIWRPITHQTVVAHHVANAQIMAEVHANISARCDAACVKKDLPFEVESLRDLCSRGAIRTVYSKCAMVK